MSIINRFEGYLSPEDLSDHIWAVLVAVEDGFQKAGLTPGKHYATKELLAFARPIVEARFNSGALSYTIGVEPESEE